MTDDMMALRGLVEKGADADLLREMIGFAAQQLMELEVQAKTGGPSPRRARSDWRKAIASGTGRRGPARWLRVPKLCTGSYFPGMERRDGARTDGS